MPDSYSGSFLSHEVKPVQQMLRLGIEVELEVAHCIPAVGQEGHLLVHLHTLRLQEVEQPAFGLRVVALDKAKAFGDSLRGNAFAHDHLKPFFVTGCLLAGMDVAAIDRLNRT
jgi:hypothetical protein